MNPGSGNVMASVMTESEWQNAVDPHPMLEILQKSRRPSPRKLRLFAVACSRRMWDSIDLLGRAAVDTAESFADGLVGPEELRAARLACQGASGQAAWYAAASNPAIAARNAARSAQAGAANRMPGAEAVELLAQANLLREIFGGRLQASRRTDCQSVLLFSVDASWLTPGVVQLAQAIYDQRIFDRMRCLADALEKAGCDNEEILSHCRGAGPHVHGCWALDLLLGRDS